MTLRTPVIEMGVSNGVAVCADDLCEPILAAATSSLSFILPLLSLLCISLFLSAFFFSAPVTDRKKKKETEVGSWREHRLDLDYLPGK